MLCTILDFLVQMYDHTSLFFVVWILTVLWLIIAQLMKKMIWYIFTGNFCITPVAPLLFQTKQKCPLPPSKVTDFVWEVASYHDQKNINCNFKVLGIKVLAKPLFPFAVIHLVQTVNVSLPEFILTNSASQRYNH